MFHFSKWIFQVGMNHSTVRQENPLILIFLKLEFTLDLAVKMEDKILFSHISFYVQITECEDKNRAYVFITKIDAICVQKQCNQNNLKISVYLVLTVLETVFSSSFSSTRCFHWMLNSIISPKSRQCHMWENACRIKDMDVEGNRRLFLQF